MKQAIHLLDPVNGENPESQFLTMRCGYVKRPVDVFHTSNTAEVTCIKCKGFINNPWRVLRMYGQVKVVEDMFVMFWGQYGYRFDMCAVIEHPGCWTIVVSHNGRWHLNLMTKAGNMAQLGFKLVDIIEAEIIKLKSPFNSPL
jgi:ribosomal protein S27E